VWAGAEIFGDRDSVAVSNPYSILPPFHESAIEKVRLPVKSQEKPSSIEV
jgi:hypothetical protein